MAHKGEETLKYTGWSKRFCAPDDYSTSSGEQRLSDNPV